MVRFSWMLLLWMWWLPLGAQIDVSAQLDSTRIMIGDQIKLHLQIAHDPGVEIREVDWSVLEAQEKIEVLNTSDLRALPGEVERMWQQDVTLTSFDSGYHWIPAIPVYYIAKGAADTVRTNELPLEVTTFPITRDSANLAPIKTIIEEPLKLQDVLPYVFLVLGIVLIAGLIIFLVRRRQRPLAPLEPEVIRPAHEVALERLETLERAQYWQKGDIKTYQSELTHIVREYLENRFQVPALESTTDEIAGQLERIGLDPHWREQLRRMLHTADMVKFAKSTPPMSVHEEVMKLARRFIEATREREEPETVDSEAESDESIQP